MDFERIQSLFEEALAQPPDQRARFLNEACPEDSTLRIQVSEMLAQHQDAFSWFDGLERDLHAAAAEDVRSPEGIRIGPYRLLRQIGRGGMGAVYLAERADGQFEQQVAIKLTRFEHESDETLRRFLAERQILSRLEHPGIARLFDGGATEQGRPYFVMEYVDGTPLTTWCDERKVSIDERLRLFLRVSEAVEYAHRNLVVHRDLKPANILVTAAGSVKLLDFGIAKLLAEGSDAPAETQTGVRPLTPDYASPEQFKGEAITTVSDVYGLGAVLYELLTGQRPLKLSSRSWTELERAILHQEPIAPSAATASSVSRALAGDLDTICLKCLQKDPERRYPSVSSLTDDIKRYLGGLPVLARKDTLAYRASKFVRRHRLGVATAAAIFVLISGFAVALAIQSARIAHERDKVQQVSELFVDMFTIADPAEGRGATITAREILDRGAEKISQQPGASREVTASLMDVMGRVYHKLGLYDRAAPLLGKALALRREALGPDHRDVAESQHRLGLALLDQGKYDAAIAALREALELRRRAIGPNDPATAQTMTYLGLALFRKADYKSAEPYFQQALDLHRKRPTPNGDLADSLTGLAMLQYGKGDYAAAEPLLREALAIQRKLFGDAHQQVAETLNNLGSVLSRLGRDGEAEPLQLEALATLRKARGPDHPRVATALNNLALMRFARGDYAGAEPLYREALTIRRARLAPTHPDIAQVLSNLGLLLQNTNHLDEAERLYTEALDIRRKTLGPAHVAIVQSLSNAGQLLQAKRDYARAEAMLRESLAMGQKLVGEQHPMVAISVNNLASLYDEMGRPEAESFYRKALAIRRKALPAQHPHIAYALVGLGQLLSARGQAAEAEPLLREALSIRQKVLPAGNWEIAEAESALGGCLLALGRNAEAEPLLVRSHQVLLDRRGSDAAATRKAAQRLASLRAANR